MKTFSPGFCDSIAGVLDEPSPCPHCQSSSHIAGGLCVGCLLGAGLDPADDAESETLTDILAEVRLPDQNWRLGNYEILEEIGRGGMGVIYRARQRHSRRIVAVKRVLSYHADSRETLARFRREAQAAASLDHPNILPIFEVSESEDGLPFFSMKFAPGGTLQQVAPALRKEPRQCVALVAKITRAVQYAHSRGILHRDLKPGNILLDARGEPFVSDFGLAKWLDTTSDLTRTLTIFGTPGYIAPEQASASAADLKPTADIYSLGAILFDLLAGRPPFLGAHALSVIRQAAELPAPKLRTLSKIADRDLETICSRCLEREPKLRYPSAHDLAEDLERWLEGRSIIARRVFPTTRLWRLARRNPVGASALFVCALLAIAVGGRQIQTWQLQAAADITAAAQHSVEVMPLFDLDNVRADEPLTLALATHLRKSLAGIGPSIVSSDLERSANTRGRSESNGPKPVSMRSILAGTTRMLNGKQRISLRLLSAAHNEVILRRIIDLSPISEPTERLASSVGRDIFTVLDTSDLKDVLEVIKDPGLIERQSRELIIAGRELADRRSQVDLKRAETCLQRAVELQPQSSKAHSELAKVLTLMIAYTSDRGSLPVAEKAARRALALDPDSGDAHQALAAVLYHAGLYRPALEELHQAFERSGIFSRGANIAAQTYKSLGRPDMELAWASIAQKDEPHPGENAANMGDCWSILVDDERAEALYKYYLELHPDQPQGWMGICRLRLLQSKFDEARVIYQDNVNRHPEFAYTKQMAGEVEFFCRRFADATQLYEDLFAREPEGGGDFYGAPSYRSVLGRIRMDTDEREGRALLEEARKQENAILTTSPARADALYRLASIEASLNEREQAIGSLDRAFAAGWIDYRTLRLDPRFDALHSEPAFETLLATMATRVTALRTAASAVLNGEQNKIKERHQ